MAPKPWAEETYQKPWLESWVPDFMNRQAQGKLHLFWAPMYEAWFSKWPEHANLSLPTPDDVSGRKLTAPELNLVGLAINSKKKQLENWFRNRRKTIGNAKAAVPRAAGPTVRHMFKMGGSKRHRAHQAIEIFQKRNPDLINQELDSVGYNNLNEEKMSEDVDDRTSEAEGAAAARRKAAKSERMRVRTRVVQRLWAEASEEEQEAVEAEVEREKEEMRKEELCAEKVDPVNASSPEELQTGIDALEGVYSQIHSATYNASGWIGMTIMGGPNPRMGGDLSLKIICFGETPAGNDFEDSCVNFDKNVTETFEAFMRQCYTAEERQSRALPERPADAAPRLSRVAAPAVPNAESSGAADKSKKKPKRVRRPKTKTSAPAAISAPPASSPPVVPAVPAPAISAADATSPKTTGVTALTTEDAAIHSGAPPFEGWSHESPQSDDWCRASPASDDEEFFQTTPDEDIHPTAPDGAATFNPWPPGMSAPLSATDAAAIAQIERGGAPITATMAIDPRLEGLTASPAHPSHETTTHHPLPGVGEARPQNPFTPSILFQAFHGPRSSVTTPSTPTRSCAAPLLAARATPWLASRVMPSHENRGYASGTARIVSELIRNSGPTESTTTNPRSPLVAAAPPTGIAPAASATAPASTSPLAVPPATAAATSTSPFIASAPPAPATPDALVAATPATAAAAATASISFFIANGPPAAVTPDPLVAATPATVATAAVAAASTPPILPSSRPMAKQPPAPKKGRAKKTLAPKKAPAPKKAAVAMATKETAVKAAKKVADVLAKRPRGRPRKEVIEEGGDAGGEVPTALSDATNAPEAPPVLTYSITNNNRREAQRAAATEKAVKAREAQEALEKQASRGWIEGTDRDNNTFVVLTRARKPTRFADGTVSQGTSRKNPHAATEAALLARTETGKASKRKASAENLAAGASKRRKER